MALTPQQIATASQCLTCADVFANEILTLLLARWAGGSTDPQTLATASTPFQGFTDNAADSAFSYMLAVIAGGSLDPNLASQNATCFSCLDGLQQRAQIYALATITGSSTDPNVLAAAASGFQGIFNQTAVQLYLLSQKSGVSASQLAAAIPCWTCGTGHQDRVQTFFFSVLAGGSIAPSAPTGLAATPGDAQIILSWTDSPGATGYNVKRSLINGGPYVTIAPNQAGTNYTDVGLTNGTTYYYVITAIGPGGESGNSNQASASPTACTVFPDVSLDQIVFEDAVGLTCLSFPNLSTSGVVLLDNDTNLSSVTFGTNIIFSGAVSMTDNPLLATLNFPAIVQTVHNIGLEFNLARNALNQASVDGVLAALDAGGSINKQMDINNGTNAAPSAAGVVHKNNLIAKGWTINTN